MGLKPNIVGKTPCSSAVRRLRKRQLSSTSSKDKDCHRRVTTTTAEKLEALKSLLPSSCNNMSNADSSTKPEQLFKETADYIVLLKTQVFVLQKLVDFYGSTQQQQHDQQNKDKKIIKPNSTV